MSKDIIPKIGTIVTVRTDCCQDILEAYGKSVKVKELFETSSRFEVTKHNPNDPFILTITSIDNPEIEINVNPVELDGFKLVEEVAKKECDSELFELTVGDYEQKGKELGALVDTKQKAYGNAIAQTYEVVKAFMTPYYNEDDKTYTIPQSLLQHLLLQVRLVDKQNRIFNNPDADLMNESPYQDMAGYSLLGANMQDKMKTHGL